MEPFIGEIRIFAGNFAPRGWAICEGQLLAISQNDALFSLLGTTYGGDGRTTFGVPDYRGRVPMHKSSTHAQGQMVGSETVTLTDAQLPSHSHVAQANGNAGTSDDAAGQFWAGSGTQLYGPGNTADGGMAPVGASGGGGAHENRSPFLAVNYIIALVGIYPSRQ